MGAWLNAKKEGFFRRITIISKSYSRVMALGFKSLFPLDFEKYNLSAHNLTFEGNFKLAATQFEVNSKSFKMVYFSRAKNSKAHVCTALMFNFLKIHRLTYNFGYIV